MDTRHAVIDTVLGEVTLVASGRSIIGLYFRHHWYRPAEATFGMRVPIASDELLSDAACQLQEYLDGDRVAFDLPAATAGDSFHERVWDLVRQIPRSQTVTYGDLADRLGDKTMAQLVGQAVGRNPLCVILPCHRVIAANGRLAGYAGGLARKKFLLDLEESESAKAERLF